ncbi:MAG: response regulator [Thermodesulfovibrionia bacterium]
MRRKLILADESIIIHQTVELVLSERNIDVEIVSDGEEALNVIRNKIPDIVLADVDLPEMDGYELCSAIKKDASLEYVVVILMVESVKDLNEERAKKAGADDYIIKPFEPEELLSKIDTAKSLKDTIVNLRKKLQKAEQKADKVTEVLQGKIDTAEASEDTINNLRDQLLETEKRADKVNKELLERKESIEKLLSRAMPLIADRIIEEIIQGPVRNESRRLVSELINATEKAVEAKVPYIVEKAIIEEKEKIERDNR